MTTAATIEPLPSVRPAGKTLAIAAALVAGNLVTDFVLLAWAQSSRNDYFAHPMMGFQLSQLALAGVWLALGDGRWYLRSLVAVPFCFAASAGFQLAAYVADKSSHEEGEWAMIGFFFLMIVLASCIAVLPLRRLREWRLTSEAAADEAAVPRLGQVNIADYLLWMIPFGGLMAVTRFVISIEDNFASQLGGLFFYLAGLLATVLAAMLTVFSARPRGWRKWLLLAAFALIVAVLLATPDIYRNFQRTRAYVGGPIALTVILKNACREGFRGVLSITGTALCATLNSLLLRRLGFRLAWR
jgi:hypothetical protein